MHFSITSLLSISCLALLASTSLAASLPRSYNSTKIYQEEAGLEIYSVYSAFNLILDDKRFDDLKYIFTTDATLTYRGTTYSTLAVIQEQSAVVTRGSTLHSYHNYNSDFSPDSGKPTSAVVTVDEIVIHFGQGNYKGQTTTVYVRVIDIFVKENGSWKIKTRTVSKEVSFSIPNRT